MSFFTRPKRVSPLPEHLEVVLGGRVVDVRLRTNVRARRYTLRLGRAGGEPVVTIPPGGSLAGARSFLDAHAGWLMQRLAARPGPRPIEDGATLPLRGVIHRIEHRPGRRGTAWVEAAPNGPVLAVAGDAEHLPRRVVDWLKREARTDLDAAVFRYASMIDKRVTAIRIRDQKGRWGSCSSRGSLSFSWRLILAPPMVLDYLAAHEVAHLREMNHSAAFWRLLHRMCPETDRAEAWLKREGASLHLFGAGEA
ncbi:MAG: M48 family metallopeptidase [Bauldia sp.]